MKILVLGSSGQLGSEIKQSSINYDNLWFFSDSQKFDFSKLNLIDNYLSKINPEIIINCAAYTSVDEAEYNFNIANIINHKAVYKLAKWCYQNNCKLIHISTDYVYGDNLLFPIKEDYKAKPINNYGKTKLLGDEACISVNPDSIIIRTSWLYSSYGNNFVKKIINLSKKNNVIKVVKDQFGAPTYAADLAEVIMKIIYSDQWISGIYNYTNIAKLSWHEFAKDIKSIYDFNCEIEGINSQNYCENVIRPSYSLLDLTKIKNIYKIKPINYLISLRKCLKILKNEF